MVGLGPEKRAAIKHGSSFLSFRSLFCGLLHLGETVGKYTVGLPVTGRDTQPATVRRPVDLVDNRIVDELVAAEGVL